MPSGQYFDDLHVGQTFSSPSYTVEADEIVSFARQYDPQPFHTDPEAGPASMFGRHVASGWHTAAITMRLFVESGYRPAGGSVGAGVDALRWLKPVVPGDVLHLRIKVTDLRASRSRPDRGIVKLFIETLNAADEVVQDMTVNGIMQRRPPSGT